MRGLAIMAALLAAPGAAAAQAPAPPGVQTHPAEPGALKAATELLLATDFDAQVEAAAHQAANATFATVMKAEEDRLGQPLPDDLKKAVQAVLTEHVGEMVIEMRKSGLEEAAQIYARYFTEPELRELQRLQTNPVMKKAQAIGPAMLSELMQIGVRKATASRPRLQATLKQVFDDWLARQRPAPRS
jgi:hypothetical protein